MKLDNLDLRGARNSIVNLRYGSDFYITNCNLSYGGNSGVQVFYTTKVHVEGNTVNSNMNSGVNFGYSPSVNSTVLNNKITNTAIFAGMNGSGDGKGIGINTNCSNITISGNEIRNTGFIGIYFGNNSSNVMVSNNYLDGFNLTKDDGGGIYTILSPVPATLPTNRSIINNVVVNGAGALPGVWQNTGESTDGIYLDNGTANVTVSGNVVANVNHQGIFLHNAKNNTVSNNLVYNTKNAISFFQNTDHPLIRNNKVTGNILFAKTASQSLITCQGPNIPLFATYSGNYFVRPSDTKNATILTLLKTYQGNAGLKTYTTASRFDFNGAGTTKAVKLDAAYVNAKGTAFSGTMNLTGYSGAALIRTGNAPVPRDTTPAAVDTMKIHITSPVDSLTYKAGDTINISASVVDKDSVMKHARYYANGVLIHTEKTFPFSWDWKGVASGKYEIIVQGEDSTGKAVNVSDTIHIVVAAARAAKAVVDTVSTISLSPVPTTNTLTVSGITGKADIVIFSIDGLAAKEVLTEKDSEVIDVSSLKAGIYVIRITYKDHAESKQFIKL
jgi:parallel beta-helix repeat protein